MFFIDPRVICALVGRTYTEVADIIQNVLYYIT